MKKLIAVIALGLVLCLTLTSCTSQTTIAALVTTLGNASAGIASLEGNSTLATALKTDTAAASAAVLNWTKGSASTEVIEALNVVEADLNLIPYVAPYSALIDIGIATVEEIIAIIQPAAPSAPHTIILHNPYTGKVPKDADHFKAVWNAAIAADKSGKLKPLEIK